MVKACKQNSVPEGYRETEIGLIPEDWEVEPVGNVAEIAVGGDLKANHFSNIRDDKFRFPVFSNTVSQKGLYGYCDLPDYQGDSLTVVGRGIGLGTAFRRSGRFSAIGRLLVLFPSSTVDAGYMVEYINDRVEIFFESGGVPQLTGLSFAKYKIPLPPTKAEQQAIANTLSDVDDLIESLEKLIAKKRAIKTGTMQQLLTGKKRLPGFEVKSGYKKTEVGLIPEDWGVDSVGNQASITTGDKNTQDRIDGGRYPFFVRSQKVERINSYSFDGEAVLTAGDGVGTGKIFHYINGKFDFHQRVYMINDFKSSLNGIYFYMIFSNLFYDRIMSMTAKSSVDSVRREMIADMKIPLPSPPEQQAIADVLSDMDAEILALEKRLQKMKALKQGMMQELLTGKTRLV